MDIESLQIKRVTSNWDEHKNYIPKKGELVMIAVNEVFYFKVTRGYVPGVNASVHPFFIIGDGDHKLEELLTRDKSEAFLPYYTLVDFLRSPSNKTPENVDTVSDPGESDELSRADHTHKITKNVINSVVDSSTNLSDRVLRRIYAGDSEPSPEDGSVGDIYIKYEKNEN